MKARARTGFSYAQTPQEGDSLILDEETILMDARVSYSPKSRLSD